MNKKTRSIINANLDKAISPPPKDRSKLNSLLDEYREPESKDEKPSIALHSTSHSTTPPKNIFEHSTTPPKFSEQLHQKNKVELRKKDRHSKDKQRVQPSIDKGILKQIKRFLDKSGLQLGEYFEMLALHHLEMVHSTKIENDTPQIDKKTIYRAPTSLIDLYEKYSKNRWTWADDKIGSKYNETQLAAIECAMIRTAIRAKKKIGTFKYFVPEIEFELSLQTTEDRALIQLASARKVYEDFKKGIPTDAFG